LGSGGAGRTGAGAGGYKIGGSHWLGHCSIDWIQGTKSSSTKQIKLVGLLLASLNHTLHNYATGFGQLTISHIKQQVVHPCNHSHNEA
jgi:hypothetical protein